MRHLFLLLLVGCGSAGAASGGVCDRAVVEITIANRALDDGTIEWSYCSDGYIFDPTCCPAGFSAVGVGADPDSVVCLEDC